MLNEQICAYPKQMLSSERHYAYWSGVWSLEFHSLGLNFGYITNWLCDISYT